MLGLFVFCGNEKVLRSHSVCLVINITVNDKRKGFSRWLLPFNSSRYRAGKQVCVDYA